MDWNGAQTLCMYVCVRVCANNIGLFLANDLVKISQEHRMYTSTNRIESLLYSEKSRSLLQNNNKQTKKMSSSLSFETTNFLADNHLFFLSENFSEI